MVAASNYFLCRLHTANSLMDRLVKGKSKIKLWFDGGAGPGYFHFNRGLDVSTTSESVLFPNNFQPEDVMPVLETKDRSRLLQTNQMTVAK